MGLIGGVLGGLFALVLMVLVVVVLVCLVRQKKCGERQLLLLMKIRLFYHYSALHKKGATLSV